MRTTKRRKLKIKTKPYERLERRDVISDVISDVRTIKKKYLTRRKQL